MRKTSLKLLSCLLVIAMIGILAAGCASTPVAPSSAATSEATSEVASSGTAAKTYDEFLTIDVFDNKANYQGIQPGWYAKVVKDKFNMELNIIAPNVAGGNDTLFQTRSAAGELGDLIMIGSEGGRLADCVKADLMYDITDMVSKSQNLINYQAAIDNIKSMISSDKVYAIPSECSLSSPLEATDGNDPTFGVYLRWDYYSELGCPEINTFEDVLPVLKQMQDKHPTSDSGQKAYAVSMFKDWDGNTMCLGKNPAALYGYDLDQSYFTLINPDGKSQYVLEDNSLYYRGLKFFFQANQLGILDPDSSTQNYDTFDAKYRDGGVFFDLWPWHCQGAYNTQENKAAGKGFMYVPVKDVTILGRGCNTLGNNYIIGVGSKAEDPQRMVDFIDWLYSPEGIMYASAQTNSTCGPEGLTWEMKDNEPALTDFGKKVFSGDDKAEMPAEWGGGTYKDGMSQLNYTSVVNKDINPVNNAPYNFMLWSSYLKDNTTPLDKSWQDEMKTLTTMEYIKSNNQFVVAANNGWIIPQVPTDVDAIRTQCAQIIRDESWKMVFAKDEAEFNALYKGMQETVKGLGVEQVLNWEKTNIVEPLAARYEKAKTGK